MALPIRTKSPVSPARRTVTFSAFILVFFVNEKTPGRLITARGLAIAIRAGACGSS